MIAIIAVNNLGYIGKDGKLMWHAPDDLAHFKSMTQGKLLLCGWNTWQTLPKVVKERNGLLWTPGTKFSDMPEHLTVCIGGKRTYERLAHKFTELHISYINDNQIGDCMFPDLRNLNPDCKIFKYDFQT